MAQLELNSDLQKNFEERVTYFADVILPIPLSNAYTYRIPQELIREVQIGSRVIVQFGKSKVLTGIVRQIHEIAPTVYEAKYILDVMDESPAFNEFQLKFIQWIAEYYMCTVGEVLNAALPSGLKISSESYIQLNPISSQDWSVDDFSERELTVLEALKASERMSFEDVSSLLGIKLIHPVIKSLIQKDSILVFEKVKDKYTPKTVKYICIKDQFRSRESLEELFSILEKKQKQFDILLKYLSIIGMDQNDLDKKYDVPKSEIIDAGLSSSSLKTLIKNGYFEEIEKVVPRIQTNEIKLEIAKELSNIQLDAVNQIQSAFEKGKPVLLHGVTGSGKTEIYIDAIQKALESGGQVLYLLPEIALTTQIVKRLIKVFGADVGVYHSRYSDNERVEIWNQVKQGNLQFVAGVRSSVFLPFNDLSLIIIDEEHDSSFKQYDPAPRFNARDCALWLSRLHGAKVLMGTATPAIDTYYQALEGKYELIELTKRHENFSLPNYLLANTLTASKNKRMKGDFTPELLEQIENRLDKNEQVILFQNRRGYSPYLICGDCSHVPKCQNCDVSLTYHMNSHLLICHYCGHKESMPSVCEACGSTAIKTVGFGTEKLEEDLKLIFPEARIQRMDQDTTRSKHGYQTIIDRFENGDTDILVGTQMISKGLDFDKVTLVGIFDYDRIVHFPDFRSHERAYQLITQVAGRSGRKSDGEVVLQTSDPQGMLLSQIITDDYRAFYQGEILERERFRYPPFYRMIRIIMKHKDQNIVNQAARALTTTLLAELGEKRVLGPQQPMISRIRNLFLEETIIKIERQGVSIPKVKELIFRKSLELKEKNIYKSLRVAFDVDPV
ncbi:replication restart helicase PriA [Reichenbachiella versicolor]|uniref:replication restart helicase PriA n=1 Tax=Reichenbachiella versicolor TaxID=1821036 RepID=UPI000D6E17F1|nr:primosomal protein N' [Reichenbachiella versicolor]